MNGSEHLQNGMFLVCSVEYCGERSETESSVVTEIEDNKVEETEGNMMTGGRNKRGWWLRRKEGRWRLVW